MAHLHSTDPTSTYSEAERKILLDVAADSIEYGLSRGEPFPVVPEKFSESLQEVRASFVTLMRKGDLRGCIGTVEACRCLIADVAENAYKSAFQDPRFPAVRAEELGDLKLTISVLTPPHYEPVESEEELLRRLRPGVDGLLIEEGSHRATFLPSVWEGLPSPSDFLKQLMKKAEFPDGYWSPNIACYFYTAETIA